MLTDCLLFIALIIALSFIMFRAFEGVGYQYTLADQVIIPLMGVLVFLMAFAVTYGINAIL